MRASPGTATEPWWPVTTDEYHAAIAKLSLLLFVVPPRPFKGWSLMVARIVHLLRMIDHDRHI